ncbi:hypothetical protein A3K73_01670 [Candidatus Pacearchaeota archaeon RBG_13_36_9]|nr:MAG: hypothetical protein A3K73_01670 [Candidatus Pacearchaeota archaeon RBG_13_36_9]
MKLSLILPLYNSAEYISECLASIKSQSFKDFELILIDDCSRDNTRELLKKKGYPFFKNENNLGFSKTLNKGITLAKGEFIAFLDHDIVYEKDFFKKMLAKNADIVGGRYYYYKDKMKIRALGITVNPLTGKTKILGRDEIDYGQFDDVKEINASGMGVIMIKREVFDRIGALNEKLIMYFVDVDFCYRARKMGYKIILSDAKCWHKKEEKEVLTEEQRRRYFHDKEIFMKNYPLAYILTRIQLFLNRFK